MNGITYRGHVLRVQGMRYMSACESVFALNGPTPYDLDGAEAMAKAERLVGVTIARRIATTPKADD